MPPDLYSRLSDISLLRRAWHLARNDSRTDFMFDPYRYSDFGFHLEEHLQGLAQSLTSGAYHPKPLLTIDVPKSSLSVRPGSVLEIEDKIVLFAIACLIAPPLDKKLPPNVYSWRVKKNSKPHELFDDHEILEFTFLKGKTIRQRISFIEPWYAAWPNFIQESERLFEKEGYGFLVVSDIVAYFENMDLDLLRNLLLQQLPHQPRIINFLINLMEYWSWPALHGAIAPRGIPQGNGFSSFLGNIYLLPLDLAFLSLARRINLKYLRYMDDVKVLAKDMSSSRQALFLMNDKLRSLRLNIQGAKTRILQGPEVREELFDERLNAVNEIIQNIQRKRHLSQSERRHHIASLKSHLRKVKGRKGIIRDKELRLFRRLLTGFASIRHSGMVRLVLDQLERNPDFRLLNSAVRYLRVQDRNLKRISERLLGLLTKGRELFPYQQAHFLMILRYSRNIPAEACKLAWHIATKKGVHWYARQQAATLIGFDKLSRRELLSVRKLFEQDKKVEMKRAWMQALTQLPVQELEEIVKSLAFTTDPKLQRVGRFYYSLLFDGPGGRDQVKAIFNQITEDVLLDRLYQVEVLSRAKSKEVRETLLESLKKVQSSVHRPLLKERVKLIVNRLESEFSTPAPTLFDPV